MHEKELRKGRAAQWQLSFWFPAAGVADGPASRFPPGFAASGIRCTLLPCRAWAMTARRRQHQSGRPRRACRAGGDRCRPGCRRGASRPVRAQLRGHGHHGSSRSCRRSGAEGGLPRCLCPRRRAELVGPGERPLPLAGDRGRTAGRPYGRPAGGSDIRERPQPLGTFLQGVSLTGAHWRIPRRTLVFASRWPATPFRPQYEKLRHDPQWETHELTTGHDVMREAPDDVVALLTS